MSKRVKHIIGDDVVFTHLSDGRVFSAPAPNNKLSGGHLMQSIIEDYVWLLEANQKDAHKVLGHLRAAYRKARKEAND